MLIVGLGLLMWLWAQFSLELVRHALTQAGWGLLPLGLLGLVWMPWDVLATAALVPAPRQWARLFLLEWSSDGFSRLIPSAGLGGEPFRYRHLRAMTEEPAKVVLAYRMFHAISGLAATLAGAALCAYSGLSPDHSWRHLAALSVGVMLVLGGALLWWRPFPVATLVSGLVPKLISRLFQVVEVAFILFLLGLAVTPQRVLLMQACLAASTFLFAFVPGGLGVQEKALMLACTELGLGAEVGFQVGLLRRCRQLLWAGYGMLAAIWLEAALGRDSESPEPSAITDGPADRQNSE
ncbi:MAG: flippase-like domain-containing protein [Candidatus Eremiobacteraeota bacterium]|nr:flippase-like domain-containing protein [Candidatus Eremiobacteraeota bacterium]